MATQIQIRRGTAATWTSANPTLADGELGYETDTLRYKMGNGSSSWTTLPYVNASAVTTVSGTTYTLALTDDGDFIETTNTGAVTITIPTNASVAFAIPTSIMVSRWAAGSVTIVGASGVTLNYYSPTSAASCVLSGLYAGATLVKRGTNNWAAYGAIA